MHTKSILIDDRLSVIGSFNWDMRSAYLNTELMLLVDCPALNAALREQTEEMMRQSRLVVHRAGTLAAQGRLAVRHTQPHPSVPVRAVSRRAVLDAARTACQNFACVHGLFKQIAKKHAII